MRVTLLMLQVENKRARLLPHRHDNEVAETASDAAATKNPDVQDQLPESLMGSSADEVSGHYLLYWAELAPESRLQQVDSLQRNDVIVLSVESGIQAESCPHGCLTLKASVTCCCPGGKLSPQIVLAKMHFFMQELSEFRVHCCRDACCPAQTSGFFLKSGERLLEGAYRQMLRTWRLHVLRAGFEDGVSVELPLQPPSALPFAAMFFAGAARFAYEPRPGARSREEHLTGSEAWPTGLKMYQRDYHAKFWILALLHERLTKQFVEKKGGAPEGSDKGAARNYKRFSQNYMKHLEATPLSF